MNTSLTPEQITHYQDDGYLIYENFLTAEETEELKTGVKEAIATMGKNKVAGGGADMVEGDSYYDKVFTQRLNLYRISEKVNKYMMSPALGKMLCELEGIDGIRMWHDQTLIKQAYGNPTGWHIDNPYWSFYSKHAISIWIALEDATFQNGCMWYIPGSHKYARFESVPIDANIGSLFNSYPQMLEVDSVPGVLKAGSCAFHNGLTAHGAGANMTRGTRMAMTAGYMPVGSTFNGQQNILSDTYFKSLKNGDVMENDDWNPVLWQKSEKAELQPA